MIYQSPLIKSTLIFAQSAGEAANETAEQTREILAEVTTWKVTQALILIGCAYIFVQIIDKLVNFISEKVHREWRLVIKQSQPFWRMLIVSLVAVILMNLFLNLSENNLLAITGTVAVALGFAFKDYVSSVIAGLIGLFEVPYRVGDRVTISNHYGEIVSYGLRAIHLRTPDDNIVVIPHNKLWTEAISNANTGELEALVVTQFYFDHDLDIELVTKILYRVAYTSKYTQLKLPIVVIVEEKPWGSLLKLKSYPMDARDEFIYQTDLIKRAKAILGKYGIAYPKFPVW
ncbi:MAG: mechanosensitive ion channel family protein [Oscillatoria sp. PMC 1051.18]|nr:mechanosensitive ion channel family protein [Oscillatoria sp. PMC 1050.18]MEC5030302.1 mechanosensitive ion channel family protein [Oscillatoria sp. PMC 1051.18]